MTTGNPYPFDAVYPNYPRLWVPINILEHEYEEIKKQGHARTERGRSFGWKSKVGSNQLEKDIHGCAGEYAVRIFLNDFNYTDESNHQSLKVGDVKGFEVKVAMSGQPHRMNLAADLDHVRSDRVYILAYTAWLPKWVVLAGWAWGSELMQGDRLTHSDNGHVFVRLDRSKLRDVMLLPKPGETPKVEQRQIEDWSGAPQGFFENWR